MLHRVTTVAPPPVRFHGPLPPSAAGGAVAEGAPAAPPSPAPAAILDVSAEGRERAALKLRISDEPFIFISDEEAGQIRAKMAKSLLDPPDPAMMIHTTGTDGTLNKLVADVVNAKMDPNTANKFKAELDRLISGAYTADGKMAGTVEERAVDMEKGLKLAEYIAENYIDDPESRKDFLDGVRVFYNNAVLREKGYDVLETPEGTRISKPGQSSIPGESPPVYIPGWNEALNTALKSVKRDDFADGHDWAVEWFNEAARVFFRNAPAGKYDELAKKFEAGEISGTGVFGVLFKEAHEKGSYAPVPSKAALAEKEREVGNTIERVKSNLDMNALMEDVQRTIKEITANFVSYGDYMKNLQIIMNRRNGITEPSGHQ